MSDLVQYRAIVTALVIQHAAAQNAVTTERAALAAAKATIQDTTEAQIALQTVALTVQQRAHERIASVVTRCLAAIFSDPYEFKIIFEQKRGRTEARLVFERNGEQLDPEEAAGGGAIDVAAFALRISCLLLARPPLRRTLLMDEPFRFVSAGHRNAVRQLLETLSRELAIQMIFITHEPAYMTGQVVEL